MSPSDELEGKVTRLVATANVAPSTVTKISKGEVIAHESKRKITQAGKSGPVRATVMDLRVWEAALKLADGVKGRIEVIASDCVIVHNHRHWKALRVDQ